MIMIEKKHLFKINTKHTITWESKGMHSKETKKMEICDHSHFPRFHTLRLSNEVDLTLIGFWYHLKARWTMLHS